MAKFWVVFVKYAGMLIEADTAEQAEMLAEDADESELIFDQFIADEWQISSVEPADEDYIED